MINVLKPQRTLLCLVLAFKSLWGRSSNHNTVQTFNDTFCSVSKLACESLHRPSIKIATRMRVATDRGRFFSLFFLCFLKPMWRQAGDRANWSCAVSLCCSLWLQVSGCGVSYFVWIRKSKLNKDSLPMFQCWLPSGSFDFLMANREKLGQRCDWL